MQYDIDYFIKKFEAIPETLWIKGGLFEYHHLPQTCALGHTGLKEIGYCPLNVDECPDETAALIKLCGGELEPKFRGRIMSPDYRAVYTVNDAGDTHPKDNMLQYLRNLKAMEEKFKLNELEET